MTVAYRFGRFELHPSQRQLLVDEQPAVLGRRAFDVLVALIERRTKLVTKNELLDLVWPGLVVEENNLQVQVSALRKLLGPDAIATVAGHGYRFTLDATQIAAPRPLASHAAKHNLPAQVSSFVGRERELVDLRAMLTRHRLVTLTGVGGIGKTRLALELAATAADVHADGVWFVDLAPVSEPSLVANTVAAALGVREEAGQPVIDVLRRFVHERAILLLLDNCEHLLLACAQVAVGLLQAGQRITIVATSREPLHVSGEAIFSLASLHTPDPRGDFSLDVLREYAAVNLFLDRATAARPDFALTHRNAAAVARICYDLDGIPLALELAAARVRAMSAESLLEHLTDRFRLLKGGDLTALPRQQMLRATIDWSYDLLALRERALLHRLSVFAGGFALDAAEAVGASDDVISEDPVDALDALTHLVDKSLVVFDVQNERYKLLETVRQYAQEHLAASGEVAATRNRHLRFYVSLAKRALHELKGSQQPTWVARLNAERENILLAFAHARSAPGGALAALTMVRGFNKWMSYSDIELWHRLILEALAHPDAQQETVERGGALYVAGFLAYLTGRYQAAFALAQSSVSIARACGDPSVLGQALYGSGVAAIAVNRPAEALANFVEGLALGRQISDRELIQVMSCGLGELYSQQGQLDLAEAAYLEAVAHSKVDREGHIINLQNLARNAIALRAEAKSVHYMREAMAYGAPRVASIQSAQAFVTNCAGIAALRGDWLYALRLSGAVESHRERHRLQSDFVDAPFRTQWEAPAREALGAVAAEAAFAIGRAMNTEAMLQAAEVWLETLPGASTPAEKIAAVAGEYERPASSNTAS